MFWDENLLSADRTLIRSPLSSTNRGHCHGSDMWNASTHCFLVTAFSPKIEPAITNKAAGLTLHGEQHVVYLGSLEHSVANKANTLLLQAAVCCSF